MFWVCFQRLKCRPPYFFVLFLFGFCCAGSLLFGVNAKYVFCYVLGGGLMSVDCAEEVLY